MNNDAIKRQYEWFLNCVGICNRISDESTNKLESEFCVLSNQLNTFNEDDKWNVYNIMYNEIGNEKLFLYVLTIFMYYCKNDTIKQFIFKTVKNMEMKWDEASSYYLQVQLLQGDGLSIKQIYEKTLRLLKDEIKICKEYIPVKQRNSNRIIIFTDQIVSELHAPTKIVLNFIYVLRKYLGYEVILMVCPFKENNLEEIWYGATILNRNYDMKECPEYMTMEYKNVKFDIMCVNEPTIEKYQYLMNIVYEWNPLFVFMIGANNPIGDLTQSFTTLVKMDMSTKCPISNADIIIRKDNNISFNEIYEPYQKMVWAPKGVPIIDENEEQVKDERLDNKFNIAIVGNRLDFEIDDELLDIMKDVIQIDNDVQFVIIGNADTIKEKIKSKIYLREKIVFLGYCKELLAVYKKMNLYLNPQRAGGGYSALMALYEGVSVVTYPDCDVASNVGNDFVVQNKNELIETIKKYIQDKRFYEMKKEKALKIREKIGYDKFIEYVKDIVENICSELEDL